MAETLEWHFLCQSPIKSHLDIQLLSGLALCRQLFIPCSCLLTCTWSVSWSAQCSAEWWKALASKVDINLECSSCVVWNSMPLTTTPAPNVDIPNVQGAENVGSNVGNNSLRGQNLIRCKTIGEWKWLFSEVFRVSWNKINVFENRTMPLSPEGILFNTTFCALLFSLPHSLNFQIHLTERRHIAEISFFWSL